jgi:hypothetical protein
MIEEGGLLMGLAQYAVFANTFALAMRGEIVGIEAGWSHLAPAGALLLLATYGLAMHALAALFARWRDA